MTQDELSQRLNTNGWMWYAVSNLTPGIIRIQLGDDGIEESGWRKCIEMPTLAEAVSEAEKFVASINAYEYGTQRMLDD